jgi:hypothetical protein
MTDKFPCEECISLAMCKHKEFVQLFKDCSIITNHIPDFGNVMKRNKLKIELLEKTIQPVLWTFILKPKYDESYKLIFAKNGELDDSTTILTIKYDESGEVLEYTDVDVDVEI